MTREYRAVIMGAGRKAGPIDDERGPPATAPGLSRGGTPALTKRYPAAVVVAAADPLEDKLHRFL